MSENEPPHLCYKNEDDNIVCHVYTEYSGILPVNGSLGQALNPENEKEWCAYPMAEYFACRIPPELEVRMAEFNQSCSIECDLVNPYILSGNNLRAINWKLVLSWIFYLILSVMHYSSTIRNAVLKNRFFGDFRNNHVLILLYSISERNSTDKNLKKA